ncbi:AAA family ATPase [Reyranella sp.]|uniref:AAA family ATPase n=1 Tax=Reyranella sp. TaxID=1929291 RepID=UPI003D0F743F
MIYVLGPFRLDTQDNLLLRGREPLALGQRALALLRALVERPGTLISKNALIEAAWPAQAVEESNLTVQIAALRKVLGEAPGGDRWIETMPRRGYRFIAPVIAEDANALSPLPIDARSDSAPSPRAGAERRQITALSCELIGTSGRTDGLDLEDMRDAATAFQRCVAETVDRHGGFVVEQLGTAALVLFGYPAAQEHDAEHAVRAGLALCAAVGAAGQGARTPRQCRVGITTGMAIIGDIGPSGASEEREIVGDAPNLAMRLRLSAQPGVVAIEAVTRRLIGGLFDCRDLGTIDSAGDTVPARAWKVLGEALTTNRFEALRGPAPTRLVGREEELRLLLRLWSRAMAGEGQVALVSGEAGLGKSHLTVALEERLAAEPHFRMRYFCSPHHRDSPLFPFADQLGQAAGFVRNDTPASRLEKLKALLAGADLPDEDAAFLLDLLALPMPEGQSLPPLAPARKRQRILEALGRHLEGLAHRHPVLVIFEDVHWIDATSRELLDTIVERARDLKVLVIVTFRPEFQPPWTGQPHVTMLTLNRLDRRDRIALAVQVAGKALPDAVIDQIADRTDGVPLFVEELTKSVLESGVLRAEPDRYVIDGALPTLAIPTSLYASLLARLDRQMSARLAAQIGAAIGRTFTYGLLRAVWALSDDELQAALARLVASELVHQRGTPPDAIYSFKHALVRDAAYGSLLRDSRQKLHALIAQALQAQSAELMETQPELFARHYAEAGLTENSVGFWAKAGQRSAARSALAEAAAHFQKGLDLLALLPENAGRLRQKLEICSALGAALRAVKGLAAPETGQAYARALELWQQLDSPSAFIEIPFGLSRYHAYCGAFDLALRLDEDLLHLSKQRGDFAGLVLAHLSSGRNLMYCGKLGLSRSHLEDLLAIDDPVSHRSVVRQVGFYPLGNAQACLGVVLLCLGYPDQALVQSSAAITAARDLAHLPSLVSILALGALPHSLVGDPAVLGEWADELVAITTEQGFPVWCAIGTTYSGWVKVKRGDIMEGISLLRAGTAAFRVTGAALFAPFLVILLASACETAGHVEESLALLDEASQIVERTGERWLEAELHRQRGELLLRQGDAAGAEELYRKALGIAADQGAKFWELRAATSVARLRREQGRHAEARDVLAPIYGWFTEGFDTADLKQAKALLDELT